MCNSLRNCPWFLSAILLATMVATAVAQKESLRPGINKGYESGDISKFVERFEREGREVYDQRNEIVKCCQIKPGMAVADVGAGTGLFTRLFSKTVGPKGRVYAVDITETFIENINKTSKEAGIDNIIGVLCKADHTMLEPNSVDKVFICDTYHHFEFPYKTMRSIHKALKPGGQVILLDFKRIEGVSAKWILGHVRAGQEVVIQEIESVGFDWVDEKKLLKDNYIIRFKKAGPQNAAMQQPEDRLD